MLLIGKASQDNTKSANLQLNEINYRNGKTVLDALLPLLVEQAELSEKLGPDHPRVQAVNRKIEFTRDHGNKLAGLSPDGAPKLDFISVYLQSLRQELTTIENEKTALDLEALEADRLARTLADDENEDRSRRSEIARLEKLFDDVSAQVRETNVNAEISGVKAQVLTPARYGELVFPNLGQFLGLGAFLGASLGIGLGYLVEIADKSFRKPEDIIREFGVPIVGHIPFMKEQRLKGTLEDSLLDKTAVCAHQPRSRPAEAFRSVRTAVCFSTLGSSHRVIQVTSPAAGDGKSTLALNLAIAMAMSGKRTVLVESDFRRPKVHKLTGVENRSGTVDLLRGDIELDEAIKSTSVEEFFVMPCGSRPKNPAELLSRPEYEQLLQVLREKFDYVIVDTPPILAVTDASAVSPRVDGVLIAMRLSRHTRDLGRRTLEQLRDVGATLLGIVINGVEESDGYGYGSYRYSDYKYYYKSYNYKYGNYYNHGKYAYNKDDYYSDDSSSETGSTELLKLSQEPTDQAT
jgi:succinoglycan biosynthesis transport protein ExoP